MIYEPYINQQTGEIAWHRDIEQAGGHPWQQYTCFEREKLKELQAWMTLKGGGYQLVFLKNGKRKDIKSSEVIGYPSTDYAIDSESNRLLKRAEFLKAVCEKERVNWLPIEKWITGDYLRKQDGRYVRATERTATAIFDGKMPVDLQPERDYYTKAEIDKMLKALDDFLTP